MSHPMWVRGLKQFRLAKNLQRIPSHPMWVHGLKPHGYTITLEISAVAPYVGAWIETNQVIDLQIYHQVAPYVGAWIETPY